MFKRIFYLFFIILFVFLTYVYSSGGKSKANSNKVSDFRIVTAFSGNHVHEARKACKSIGSLIETQQFMPEYMIAYLLKNDTTANEMIVYQNQCPFVTIRYFDAKKHPDLVEDLFQYLWKPLVVSEGLKETKNVFWIDSSIIFHQNTKESIQDVISKMETNYSKCGIRYFSSTFHSIYSATHSTMLQNFNVSLQSSKQINMLESGWFVVSKIASRIVKEWKLCAQQKECFAPSGSQQECNYSKLRSGEYGDCHRYDQSVLNLLTLKCSTSQHDYYMPSLLVSVNRLGDFDRFTFSAQTFF